MREMTLEMGHMTLEMGQMTLEMKQMTLGMGQLTLEMRQTTLNGTSNQRLGVLERSVAPAAAESASWSATGAFCGSCSSRISVW